MKSTFLSVLCLLISICGFAQQAKSDVFNGETSVTFLGLDFSQTKFIGSATQFKDAGDITNNAMREKYIPAWNGMFTSENEKKNFKVADAVHRMDVDYATEITEKANNAINKKDFFSENMEDFPKLDESKISALVKRYDFMGKKGIGLLLFVEGMRKGEEKGDPSYARVMVTFVDMRTKTVLLSKRVEGKATGFGFRNFWAGAWKNVLKGMKDDWNSWKK